METFVYRVCYFNSANRETHALGELYGAKQSALRAIKNLNRQKSSTSLDGGHTKDHRLERLIMLDNGATIPITNITIWECTEGSNFRISPWAARSELVSEDDKYQIWKADFPDQRGYSYFLVDINAKAK